MQNNTCMNKYVCKHDWQWDLKDEKLILDIDWYVIRFRNPHWNQEWCLDCFVL